jgi:hypothetical protein
MQIQASARAFEKPYGGLRQPAIHGSKTTHNGCLKVRLKISDGYFVHPFPSAFKDAVSR